VPRWEQGRNEKHLHVELLQLDRSGSRVASYPTALPPRDLLQQKLHDAVRRARARLEARPAGDDA
jgi:hypothetical protein